MLAGMSRHDVMIGSRYVPGGGTDNWPRHAGCHERRRQPAVSAC